MRDAFGGAFMIQIFLIFILVYICFTAMALNYAKAFKVKNAIIEYLESSEISDLNTINAAKMDELNNFINNEVLGNFNYNLSASNICNISGVESTLLTNAEGKVYGYCHNSGIEIVQSGEGINTEGVYYTVSTYIGWYMPFLNNILSLSGSSGQQDVPTGLWRIAGQTRLIVNE